MKEVPVEHVVKKTHYYCDTCSFSSEHKYVTVAHEKAHKRATCTHPHLSYDLNCGEKHGDGFAEVGVECPDCGISTSISISEDQAMLQYIFTQSGGFEKLKETS